MVAAVLLSLIVGQVLLNVLKSPASIDDNDGQITSGLLFYICIQYLTPVVCLGFLINYIVHDRRPVGEI